MLRGSKRTHAAVPAFGVGVGIDDRGIASLQVFLSWRLDSHVGLGAESAIDIGNLPLGRGSGRISGRGCGHFGFFFVLFCFVFPF